MTTVPHTTRTLGARTAASLPPRPAAPLLPRTAARTAGGSAGAAGTVTGALQVTAAAVLWGVGAAAAAFVFAISTLSPAALSFWRFALAAAILLALHTLRRVFRGGPGLFRLLRSQGPALLLTGALLAAAQTLMYASVASMGAGLGSTLVLATGPVVMALLSIPVLGLTLNRAGWLTMVPALAAITALLLVSGEEAKLTVLGPVFAVAAATSHSLMTLVSKKLAGSAPPRARDAEEASGDSDLLGRTALTFVAASLALLPVAAAQGLALGTARPGLVIALIAILAVCMTVVPYLLYFDGVTRIAPATAGVLMMCQLAAANIAGVVLLGERISLLSGLLLCALIASIVLHVRLSRSRPTRAAPR
ncbi:DMT family transporter [Brevibacterium sp.]|uniref:EamA family transporter n=1 Tax=Brevibacterium sp. TaxID=1701 RepID=UPI0025B8950C|nr:DMT family transporter [Brevibacterium sp.]